MFYDLHLHSALSPCADNDMTPSTVVGLMVLAGAEVIAITDHNSARNLPAAKKAAENYNVKLIPGIEVNTSEEIHLLCYFKGVDEALKMGEMIYDSLPDIINDETIWGEQLVIDEEDEVIDKVDKLLSTASGFGIYELVKIVRELGGIAVPAHVDRDTYSLLSVLGFLPDDLDFEIIELQDVTKYAGYVEKGLLPEGLSVISSSDAHSISRLKRDNLPVLGSNNPILSLT